jgi:hypothetical protein
MPMPYTLTRGPLLTLLENALNPKTDPERITRNEVLAALRAGTPLASMPWVAAGGPGQSVAIPGTLDIRLEQDWFGRPEVPGRITTGYWVGYRGDVEGVLREGLIRAIEVSLGIAHDGDPAGFTRSWPVDIQWKCPNPWFEVWVTWRRHKEGPNEEDRGQVNMLIATPPDRVNRLTTEPRNPPPTNGVPEVPTPLVEPVAADEVQGMWLVTNEHHAPLVQLRRVDTGTQEVTAEVLVNAGERVPLPGLDGNTWDIPIPSTVWHDTGDVVVVAPPSYAGGADVVRTNAPT